MEFENLIKLIETVSASELTGFQYEEKGIKLKLSKVQDKVQIVNAASEVQASEVSALQETTKIPSANGQIIVRKEEEETAALEGKIVKSPLVGTFYAAPSEDADNFVAVGDTVKKGQILAIVEAMKLMNEIESEYDGVIEEILVKNGQPVEYDQPLFRLK